MSTYQGHHPDGSSIQKHSAGGAYPYVLVLRDSQREDSLFDWGLVGGRFLEPMWYETGDDWNLAVDQLKGKVC